MYEVEIADQQSRLPVDPDLIRQLVSSVLVAEAISAATISVAVVDDSTIHALNRQYLQHDYATDVLSFVLDSRPDSLEGEIIVSADTAIQQAPLFESSPLVELMLYVVHGMLHLVGYEDRTDEEKSAMRIQERRHLDPMLDLIRAASIRSDRGEL